MYVYSSISNVRPLCTLTFFYLALEEFMSRMHFHHVFLPFLPLLVYTQFFQVNGKAVAPHSKSGGGSGGTIAGPIGLVIIFL